MFECICLPTRIFIIHLLGERLESVKTFFIMMQKMFGRVMHRDSIGTAKEFSFDEKTKKNLKKKKNAVCNCTKRFFSLPHKHRSLWRVLYPYYLYICQWLEGKEEEVIVVRLTTGKCCARHSRGIVSRLGDTTQGTYKKEKKKKKKKNE